MTLKGRVYVSDNYQEQIEIETRQGMSELQHFLHDFKIYWAKGYHLSFGKDTQFARPFNPLPGIIASSIRKAHVRPAVCPTQQGTSRTQSAWDFIGKRSRATSNIYMVYAVNQNRDAYVMALIHRAHEVTLSDNFMHGLMETADYWYEELEVKPMLVEDHADLWSEDVWGV